MLEMWHSLTPLNGGIREESRIAIVASHSHLLLYNESDK